MTYQNIEKNIKCKKNLCFPILNTGRTWNIIHFLRINAIDIDHILKNLRYGCIYKGKKLLFSRFILLNNNRHISSSYYESYLSSVYKNSLLYLQMPIYKYFSIINIYIYDYDYTYYGTIKSILYNGYQYMVCIRYSHNENIHIILGNMFIKAVSRIKKYVIIDFSIFK